MILSSPPAGSPLSLTSFSTNTAYLECYGIDRYHSNPGAFEDDDCSLVDDPRRVLQAHLEEIGRVGALKEYKLENIQ